MTTGISPKLIAAVIAAVITYLLGQELLELPAWAQVTGQTALIALAVYRASPGSVTPPQATSSDDRLGTIR